MIPSDCERFRSELIGSLTAGRPLDALVEVHGLECASCREFREREERLEALLDLLPAGDAPGELPTELPTELVGRVRAALAEGRSDLDELLESVPAPSIPPGLSDRVLHGLASERRSSRRGRPLRMRALAALAIAAGLLLAFVLWRAAPSSVPPEPRVVEDEGSVDPDPVATEPLDEDEDLLAYALERWELLENDDLDLWLAGLDPMEQALIEVAGSEVLSELESEGGLDGPR